MNRLGVSAQVAALATLAAPLIAGCAGGGRAAAPTPATLEQRLNLAVVAVDAQIGSDEVRSSGAVIDGDRGLILTSAHSIWGARSLKVATALGVLHGRIVARAPCDDLALLETQPRIPGLEGLGAPASRAPAAGQLLTAVGRRVADADVGPYSLLSIPARVVGAGEGERIDRRLPALRTVIRLDARLVPESSGGPLVDRAGRLVGLAAVAAAPAGAGLGAAVPWSAIQQRLAELRPGPRRVYVGWREQYRCVQRLHAFARAAHPGFRPRDARLNAPVPATRLPGTSDLDEG